MHDYRSRDARDVGVILVTQVHQGAEEWRGEAGRSRSGSLGLSQQGDAHDARHSGDHDSVLQLSAFCFSVNVQIVCKQLLLL
jgi:hypothetical protein